MKKIIIALLSSLVIATTSGVLADEKGAVSKGTENQQKIQSSEFLNGKPFESLESGFITQDELDALNQAIEVTNQRIDDLEDRIIELEAGGDPDPVDVVFSGQFTNSQAPTTNAAVAWSEFLNQATGEFSAIEIKSSLGGSVVCSDPLAATDIANELNTHVLASGSISSFGCQDLIWNVGSIGNSIELNAGPNVGVNACTQDAVVRPGIDNANWGGFAEFGGSCGAPSQVLEVILTR